MTPSTTTTLITVSSQYGMCTAATSAITGAPSCGWRTGRSRRPADGGPSIEQCSSFARCARSPVDVPEDEVEAGEDRDDVGHVRASQQPRQHRDVVEAGRADLAAERPEPALAHDVEAHLAERVVGVHPRLAGRHLDDARDLGLDGPGREALEHLVD